MSSNDTYPQHVVTAVIVAHDGATWLPRVLDALLEQTRPVQRVVAVDTGSRDRSGAVLAAKLGQAVVFGMDRATGYGAAVAKALAHRAASTRIPARPGAGGDHVEWVWLLHDDCEPAADALEQLLRGAAETPKAAVLGPKVMDWSDRDVLLEAGVTIDTVGRRVTGVEAREVDQGQHDGDRDTLAVSSAGMLVRRDVWDALRGFDPAMPLFREDMDFCWRVHAAGYRVRVITDAVVFHAQAMSRRRRPSAVGRRGALLDRRNALLTLLGNLPLRPMLASLAGNLILSVLRALFFLVAKRVTAAMDEAIAAASVLGHPLRLLRVRQQRARGRKQAYGRLRADIPPGRSVRRFAEAVSTLLSSGQQDTRGSHHAAMEDPDDEDFLLTDSGIVQRILTHPGVLLFLGLLILTLIAERAVIGAGSLGGGALLPAPQGASGLWQEYFQGFHPAGIGSPSVAPPYLAVVAALATVLLGKAWLAVDVMLLGSVPIAGLAAYRAIRQVTASVPVRIWVAAAYALLPVATGAIGAGRLGSAAAFVAIPVIGLLAGRMLSKPPRLARRAAWATGLAVALGAAFVPLLWLVAVLAAGAAALTLRAGRPALLRNLGIVVVVPPVLLLPWSLQLAAHPATLLLEVGVQQPGLASPDLAASRLLLLSPGGPGLPPSWVTAGLLIAAIAALLSARRRPVILAGWSVAALGLLVAAVISRIAVRPPAGGPPVTVWPGAALAVAAAGLLLAAAAAGDSPVSPAADGRGALSRMVRARGVPATLIALVAAATPVAAGALWLLHGVTGPLAADDGQIVPAGVAATTSGSSQGRTLVLRSSGSGVSYLLLRGNGPQLGDGDLIPVPSAERALQSAVAALVAPAGGQAVSQAAALARLDVSFVLMRAPVNTRLARALDGIVGMRPVSITSQFDLWRLATLPSRVSVVESSGKVVPVRSGSVSASGTVPAAGGTLTVAEPGGGWSASLNGTPLTPVASPAGRWAQAFRLPPGGGTVQLSRSGLGHDLGIGLELLATLAVGALALPGIRTAGEAPAAAAAAATAPARPAAGAGDDAEAAAPTTVTSAPGRPGGRGTSRPAGAGRRDRLGGVGAVQQSPGRGGARRSGALGSVAPDDATMVGLGASGPGGVGPAAAGPAASGSGASGSGALESGAPGAGRRAAGLGAAAAAGAAGLAAAGESAGGRIGRLAGRRAGGRGQDRDGASRDSASRDSASRDGARGGFLGAGSGRARDLGADDSGPGSGSRDMPGARGAGQETPGRGFLGAGSGRGARDLGADDSGPDGGLWDSPAAGGAGRAGAAGDLAGRDSGGWDSPGASSAGRDSHDRAGTGGRGRDSGGQEPAGQDAAGGRGKGRGLGRRKGKAAQDAGSSRRGRGAAAASYDSGAYDSAGFSFSDSQPGAGAGRAAGRAAGGAAAGPDGDLPASGPPGRGDTATGSGRERHAAGGYRSATGAGPDYDSDPADRTAAFDSGALRGTGAGYDSAGNDSAGYDGAGHREAGYPGASGYGAGDSGSRGGSYRGSGDGDAGYRGSDAYRGGDDRSGRRRSAGYGGTDPRAGDYGSPDHDGADYASPDHSSPAAGSRSRPADPPANYYGYGADEADPGRGAGQPGYSGSASAGGGYGSGGDYATTRFDSGQYDSGQYDSPPGQGGQPGQNAGRRSPTGAWPPDDTGVPGGPVPPPDRISRARLPGDAPAGYGPPDRPGYGDSGRSRSGRSASGSWDSPAAPPPARPPQAQPPRPRRSQPGQSRPDPGWPDDRWQDARQRDQGGSPSGDSGSWPQPDAQAAWPDSGSSGWSSGGSWDAGGGQHWQPEAQQGGWGGQGDSLEPLPSAELHPHGGTRPDERSRRRWPEPDADDEEAGTW